MNASASSHYSGNFGYGNKVSELPQSATPRLLFISGWVISLLYIPSGVLHYWLGSGVYFRDGLLFLHLAGCLVWLKQNRELSLFAGRHWLLLVPILFVFPAVFNGNARVEALTFIKWVALWVDWLILGRLARFESHFTRATKILITVTLLVLVADLIAGTYERSTHTFVLASTPGVTAFGVELDREAQIGDQLRVKGLQRDVFSFANLMGMSAVLGLWMFVNSKDAARRLLALIWSVSFAVMLLMSGGRSALFGVVACYVVAASLVFMPEITRRNYSRVALGWLVLCLAISCIGVGQLSESIGGSVLSGSSVGNSVSAYMRDDNWAGILDAIKRVPVVLIFGGPLSSLLDPKIDAFFHWADNQYLWLLYHSGLLGAVAIIWYFRSIVDSAPRGEPPVWVRDMVILFLLFVMGEAVARESLTFIGCMPLFLAIGFYETGRTVAKVGERRPNPERRRQPAAATSDVSDFTRRIRARAKQRK